MTTNSILPIAFEGIIKIKQMKKITITLLFTIGLTSYSQQQHFTEQDSLRGSITPERSWWDLNF